MDALKAGFSTLFGLNPEKAAPTPLQPETVAKVQEASQKGLSKSEEKEIEAAPKSPILSPEAEVKEPALTPVHPIPKPIYTFEQRMSTLLNRFQSDEITYKDARDIKSLIKVNLQAFADLDSAFQKLETKPDFLDTLLKNSRLKPKVALHFHESGTIRIHGDAERRFKHLKEVFHITYESGNALSNLKNLSCLLKKFYGLIYRSKYLINFDETEKENYKKAKTGLEKLKAVRYEQKPHRTVLIDDFFEQMDPIFKPSEIVVSRAAQDSATSLMEMLRESKLIDSDKRAGYLSFLIEGASEKLFSPQTREKLDEFKNLPQAGSQELSLILACWLIVHETLFLESANIKDGLEAILYSPSPKYTTLDDAKFVKLLKQVDPQNIPEKEKPLSQKVFDLSLGPLKISV